MPLNTAVPSERRISAPAPEATHQRHDAEDEGERGHQDRPQPQPRRLQRRLEDATGPPGAAAWRTRRSRMAFLHARPTSTTRPICTKMLTSPLRDQHAGDRAEQAQRHHQDDRQRQRPALVQRRQGQEDAHHRQREDDQRRCCPRWICMNISSVHSAFIERGSVSSAELVDAGDGVAGADARQQAAGDRRGGVQVVARDEDRAGRSRAR